MRCQVCKDVSEPQLSMSQNELDFHPTQEKLGYALYVVDSTVAENNQLVPEVVVLQTTSCCSLKDTRLSTRRAQAPWRASVDEKGQHEQH